MTDVLKHRCGICGSDEVYYIGGRTLQCFKCGARGNRGEWRPSELAPEEKEVPKSKTEFRFELKGRFDEPHWLTGVKRWDDGSIRETSYSFVAKKPWSCRKRKTAEKMQKLLDEYYDKMSRDNPFEMVEVPSE